MPVEKSAQDPLALLRLCGGYYEVSKTLEGKRLSPLVGYAGRYGEQKLQYVGDVYCNFAAAERSTEILEHFANSIDDELISAGIDTTGATFCGAPEGGKALAFNIAWFNGGKYIYPEKKITALATANSREESHLVFDRHIPVAGDEIVIVEDVCNNFSTTADLVRLIESYGARVIAIACFLNRSDKFIDTFEYEGGSIPVVSLVKKAFGQYSQDDPFVVEDIRTGNVVWKPKNEWDKLTAAVAA